MGGRLWTRRVNSWVGSGEVIGRVVEIRRPWLGGSINREQGISQSGNPRLRTTMIQLAWLWIRHQPGSAITLSFKDEWNVAAVVGARRRSWRWRASCWSRSGKCERGGRDRRRHD